MSRCKCKCSTVFSKEWTISMMNILIEITIIIIWRYRLRFWNVKCSKTVGFGVNWYYDVNAALEICNECLQWGTLEFKPNNQPDVCRFFFLSSSSSFSLSLRFSYSILVLCANVYSVCHVLLLNAISIWMCSNLFLKCHKCEMSSSAFYATHIYPLSNVS